MYKPFCKGIAAEMVAWDRPKDLTPTSPCFLLEAARVHCSPHFYAWFHFVMLSHHCKGILFLASACKGVCTGMVY